MPRSWLCVSLIGLVVGGLPPPARPHEGGGPHLLRHLPVTGGLADGGTFAGHLTVEALTVTDRGHLAATGVLTGTAARQRGTVTTVAASTFTALAPLLDLRGTCTTFVLDVAPIFLAPLGQQVTLRPVVLDMQRIPKAERLLGTALCALARLQEYGLPAWEPMACGGTTPQERRAAPRPARRVPRPARLRSRGVREPTVTGA
jgi:hypothetical protein